MSRNSLLLHPQNTGKILLLTGVLFLVLGALFYGAGRFPFLAKLLEPLRWRKGVVTVYFPLGLCLLLSILLTLFLRFWRH